MDFSFVGSAGVDDVSQLKKNRLAAAPANCAAMNQGVSAGRIPAKVLVRERASVTAGFANDVEAVNQYADVM